MVSITMKQLLEAGVHFGHQTKRWNPKMKEYIFGQRNGIYIIDLQKSIRLFKNAIQFMYDLGSQGKTILFLGTKRQAQECIQEAAQKTSTYYVNQRWLGGLLTNFVTIQKSIKRFRELEAMRSSGQYDLFSKKEVARYERERKKLEKNLSGIKDMTGLPDALFVIDTRLETIAIKEAVKLGIPVVGVADTNCDPDEIDYIIPGNDDALRAIRLITDTIAQAYLDGKSVYEAQQKELAEKMEKQRQLYAQQAAAAREAAGKAAAARNAEAHATDQAGVAAEDAQDSAADEKAATAESAAKPKTTVRKTLQRKARTRKPEAAAAPAKPEPTEPPRDAKSDEEATPVEAEKAKAGDPESVPAAGSDN
ncbi:MAG: 30S ribosomal protein S2 [Acidobacteria bacterium]|nr:30S ribosomal protein S2 [Acidobacteriota bacterium]